MDKWNQRFFNLARHVSTWSKDPSTKVGAVVVNDQKQVLGMGYNGFPRKIFDIPDRYNERELKYRFVVHAERNALDNAFTDVKGCSLYVTHFPCCECAKGIIQKGITEVYTPKPDFEKAYMKNRLDYEVTVTLFNESGIQINFIDDPVDF